jgi:hypothetical protein
LRRPTFFIRTTLSYISEDLSFITLSRTPSVLFKAKLSRKTLRT